MTEGNNMCVGMCGGGCESVCVGVCYLLLGNLQVQRAKDNVKVTRGGDNLRKCIYT